MNRLGFGAMRITGPGIWGDPPDRDRAREALRRAVALDVTFIDTADSYGPEVSEKLIAETLYPYPENLVIATKGGLTRPGPGQWCRCRTATTWSTGPRLRATASALRDTATVGGPMTAPGYSPGCYGKAEELAAEARRYLGQEDGKGTAAVLAAVAQVHATVAVAEAIEAAFASRRRPEITPARDRSARSG